MNMQSQITPEDISAALGMDSGARKRRWARRLVYAAAAALLLGLAGYWYYSSEATANAVAYDTAPAVQAPLTVTVTATGTVQPTTQVDVSSEISGVIRTVNVDANSIVKKGDVLAALDVKPAEITWKAGIDVMSFGGTKNGGMLLEAVVFFDTDLAEDFLYRRMRGGQLVSKSRYLGAQMLAYLEGNLWLDNARTANGYAKRLAEALKTSNRIRLPLPSDANEVFAVIPLALHDKLQAQGVRYFDWMPDTLGPGGIKDDEIFVRFVLSYATPPKDVERFVGLIKELSSS